MGNRARIEDALRSNPKSDFRGYLNDLTPNGILYSVYANYKGTRYTVGQIVFEDHFCASPYGDQKLFFRHHR